MMNITRRVNMNLDDLLGSILAKKNHGSTNQETRFIYATRINGKFDKLSEATIISLNEEEAGWKVDRISKKYCPGYTYFLELELVEEMLGLQKQSEEYDEEVISRVIGYANDDA